MVGVAPDGRIGPATLAADRKADPTEGIARLCDARLAWLKTLKTWPTFGGGWERRVTEVRYNALLAAAAEAFAKAVVEDVRRRRQSAGDDSAYVQGSSHRHPRSGNHRRRMWSKLPCAEPRQAVDSWESRFVREYPDKNTYVRRFLIL